MLTTHQPLRRKWKIMLLVRTVLGGLVSSPSAFAAERERAVLFLSVEDLQLVLARSPSLSFLTYQRLAPGSEWQEQSKAVAQESGSEQSLLWGTGLEIDSYTHLGTRPLWGY
jgi:hypothetical protein